MKGVQAMTTLKAHRRGVRFDGTLYGLKGRGNARHRPVHCDSTTEMDQAILLEEDRTALEYHDHPFTITGSFPDGTKHMYTPDFLVIRATGKELIECKHADYIDDEATRQQRTIGEAWAAAHGYQYRLVTDKDLNAGSRLTNVKLLWRYRLHPVPSSLYVRCFRYLDEHPEGVSFGALTAHLSEPETPRGQAATLYYLLFHHELETDLDQPLTNESLLKRTSTQTG